MAKYEVILKHYPPDDDMPNGYWVAVCPAVAGCVTDGETREEALAMVADAIDFCLEDDEPLDAVTAEREKAATLREAQEENVVIAIETHLVEPKAMTDEELATWPTSAHLVPGAAS
jgi:predicted RNase H-like HicB family nuclease